MPSDFPSPSMPEDPGVSKKESRSDKDRGSANAGVSIKEGGVEQVDAGSDQNETGTEKPTIP